MKKQLLITAFFLIACTSLRAQHPSDIREGNADYPVPTPLAMYALAGYHTPMLEPFTVRNYAVAFRVVEEDQLVRCFQCIDQEEWFAETQGRVGFGFEIAPFLIGNGVDLSKYLSGRMLRVLLRTRLSIAYSGSENEFSRLGVGIRWMLHDDADLRSDSVFQKELIKLSVDPQYMPDRARQGQIDSFREEMKEDLWNRSVVELGAGYVSEGIGGYRNPIQRSSKLYASIAGGFPLYKTSSQIAFGVSGSYSDADEPNAQRVYVGSRIYLGTPSERVYLEVGGESGSRLKPDIRAGAGLYVGLGAGFWLNPYITQPFRDLVTRTPFGRSKVIGITVTLGQQEIRHQRIDDEESH